ncbi:MAG: OmpH family outer membrane protein [Bdellovibrionaceae bacterium]|nr:OmpH family outer membrane protein [Bdellovibrionales bacterium]MCB9254301.1 OmpH family outer membrane protein [Pseudobdellovibrionaceae bacterium]
MKQSFRSLALLLALALVGTGSSAWAVVSVGYVDMQAALTSVSAGKKAKERLEQEIAKKKVSLEKEQEGLQKEAQEFEKKAALLNESARAQKQQELQKKFLELQKKMHESQVELQKRERELTKPIIDSLRSIVEALGKEKKFDLILEKNEGAVLYAQSGTDLTQEVIARFNKKK